ncbi:MAG: precorrin-6y C5,15-methyltransferase (decarboxylating) subunit CbiE [Bacillota bacterium]
MHKVQVLGIGPGNQKYIPPVVKNRIEAAEVLIGGNRILKDYEKMDKELIFITANLNRISKYIKDNHKTKKIAVLLSGDTGLYSFLKYLRKQISAKYLEVIPGISSLQLAFARNKMVWQDADIISLHGKKNLKRLLQAVANKAKVGLFTDNDNSPDVICRYLKGKGYGQKHVFIGENLSYKSEKIYRGKVLDFVENKFAPLTVMVIYDEKT